MPIRVAILWHQHQPYYRNLLTGELVMPWVRLHGLKDYYGMARLFELHPGMRGTINLVPSLVVQLLEYVEHQASDPFLRCARLPADGLAEEDARFILDHFFMAQWDRMIRPHPRYRELLEARRLGRRPASAVARDFSPQDLRDLQVWFHLAWFHPLSISESDVLRGLLEKGSSYSEQDKAALWGVHDAVLARILPLHRELRERGQVELSTTPFYHPILPLLCDMECAKAALPRAPLPPGWRKLTEDAEAHVAKALALHERVFGERPLGMWPAEGSVSPEVVALLARHGIQWIATDEEILGASLGAGLRGPTGGLERPEWLYRPWRVRAGDAELNIVFRDHQFSDLIGFQYQSWDGEAAATDLLARIAAAARDAPAGPETLVTIILDGENCWEHYPDQGLGFLRTLYGRLAEGYQGLTPVRLRDALAAGAPTRRLDKLFPGSWINHDFYIWMGHAEDRKAWEYIFRVREDLVREAERRAQSVPQPSTLNPQPFAPAPAPRSASSDAAALARAWEALYIAEGSDWFWWYGDDHTSANDEAFDALFRQHLKSVYLALGLTTPYFLDQPILAERAPHHTLPRAMLRVIADGRVTGYFEWLGAGVYRSSRDHGVMNAAGRPLLSYIHFGYDREAVWIRVDPYDDPRTEAGAPVTGRTRSVKITFGELGGLALQVEKGPPVALSYVGPWPEGGRAAQAEWDEVLEARIPFAALGLGQRREVVFFVDATGAEGAVERFPRAGALQFTVPPPEAEESDWIA